MEIRENTGPKISFGPHRNGQVATPRLPAQLKIHQIRREVTTQLSILSSWQRSTTHFDGSGACWRWCSQFDHKFSLVRRSSVMEDAEPSTRQVAQLHGVAARSLRTPEYSHSPPHPDSRRPARIMTTTAQGGVLRAHHRTAGPTITWGCSAGHRISVSDRSGSN